MTVEVNVKRNLKHRLAHSRTFYGPNGETMRVETRERGPKVVMRSPRTGEHNIDLEASSNGRIAAHWAGFLGSQGGE